MRTTDIIKFVKEGLHTYNDDTGNYEPSDSIETTVIGMVSDTGEMRMNFLYGGIKQSAKTIRLLSPFKKEYDYVLINGKKYQVDLVQTYRQKQVIEVSAL